jgi:hypothetical protein
VLLIVFNTVCYSTVTIEEARGGGGTLFQNMDNLFVDILKNFYINVCSRENPDYDKLYRAVQHQSSEKSTGINKHHSLKS